MENGLAGFKRTKSEWIEYRDMLEEQGERHFIRNMEEGGAELYEAHAFLSEVETYDRGELDPSMILEDLEFGFGKKFIPKEDGLHDNEKNIMNFGKELNLEFKNFEPLYFKGELISSTTLMKLNAFDVNFYYNYTHEEINISIYDGSLDASDEDYYTTVISDIDGVVDTTFFNIAKDSINNIELFLENGKVKYNYSLDVSDGIEVEYIDLVSSDSDDYMIEDIKVSSFDAIINIVKGVA